MEGRPIPAADPFAANYNTLGISIGADSIPWAETHIPTAASGLKQALDIITALFLALANDHRSRGPLTNSTQSNPLQTGRDGEQAVQGGWNGVITSCFLDLGSFHANSNTMSMKKLDIPTEANSR